MFPHPDTAIQLGMIEHTERQREVARLRLADQVAHGRTPGVAVVAGLQDALGRALIHAGQRLQGIAPAAGMSDGSPAIGSGAAR